MSADATPPPREAVAALIGLHRRHAIAACERGSGTALGSLASALDAWGAEGRSRLFAVAVREEVLGPLADAVEAAGFSVPPHARQVRLQLKAREAFAGDRLRLYLDALHRAGVPVAPLKGASLIGRVYPHGGRRAFSDIDLLGPPDPAAATRVLVDLGLRPAVVDPRRRYADRGRFGVHVALIDRGVPGTEPLLVELHHRLYADLDTTYADEVRSAATQGTCGWTRAPALRIDAADQFVIAAHHLVTSPTRPLRFWLDLAMLAEHHDPAQTTRYLDRVAARGAVAGDGLTAWLGLWGAVVRFGPRVPAPAWKRAWRGMRQAERAVFLRVIQGPDPLAIPKLAVLRALWRARHRGLRHRHPRLMLIPTADDRAPPDHRSRWRTRASRTLQLWAATVGRERDLGDQAP